MKERYLTLDHDKPNVVTIVKEEDLTAAIDAATEQRNDLRNGFGPRKEGWRKVASIPLIVVEQWLKEGFNVITCDDEKELRKRINEWSKFRLTDKAL
jgi:hypothetical protein